ncbi:MAG: asparagine synthase (glutamine-hydrolyzing) [Vicinamibacteria bacterium]|nr:asparagine synthase (glutamine-hydrolyzing) [Vicinamibacteria bacterium]
MCGIAGIFHLRGGPVEEHDIARMCDALTHRGPDEGGVHLAAGIGIGMRRLSVIDVAGGSQPIGNEDGSVWVVFNGEIYNFRDLRRELIGSGHVFRTQTDTEVIAHLYEERGASCVEHLRGMFAFALWDAGRRQLLLARDRLGVKPLYWTEAAGRLVFASELKAILQLREVERQLDWGSVDHLFTHLTTPASDSIIEGVHKLEPGHVLTASVATGVRRHRYWAPRFEPDRSKGLDHFVEGVRGLLEESVRLRLVSDVPLGAFLSGGLDSSAVVATMAGAMDQPVRTFSIGFAERAFDELRYARLIAEKFGTLHRELIVEPNVVDILDDIAWFLDEPFGDSSAIPTYLVSQMAAEHVTVVLSGDGGDELFAGYDKYRIEGREREALPALSRAALRAIGRYMPDGMRGRNFVRHHGLTGAERYLDASTLFREDQKRRLFQPEAYARLAAGDEARNEARAFLRGGGHWLSELQQLDIERSLPLDILTKVDRMSMAHSLEAREPLLDHKLVEFAATIPPEMQIRDGSGKSVFKQAMRGVLPDTVIDRRKQGFGVPLGSWFRASLSGFLRDLLLSGPARDRGIFEPAYVLRLIERHEAGQDLGLHLWTLISFELWCRAFLDRTTTRPRVRPARGCVIEPPRSSAPPLARAARTC